MNEMVDAAEHPKLYEIRLLICVAQADGYLDESEKERIFHQVNLDIFTVRERQIFHDDIENPKKPTDLAEEVSPYLSQEDKLMLIRKMFKLAALDKDITEEEKETVYLIAQSLGIEAEKVKAVEHWVKEGVSWAAKWKVIIS
jgi:uncharacterized tellurite resistance protein B-like protein